MKLSDLQKIEKAVEDSKSFPNPTIEYNLDLPKVKGITPTKFYGVDAFFNPNVKRPGANVTFSY